MAFQDLRSFLAKLKEEGQLVTVSESLWPEPDVSKYLRAAVDLGDKGPAVMFDNIKGYKGKTLVGNVHGSWANHGLIYGMSKDATVQEQFHRLDQLWDNVGKGQLKRVENPPCQECVIDQDINLYELLPLFRLNPDDGGCYLSKACTVSRDPDEPDNEDKENVGVYRIQVQGKDFVGLQVAAFHDLGVQLNKAERRNEAVPVAICLGNPPGLSLMGSACLEYGQSEFKVAAALMGEPLEVAKAMDSNLNVPAGAEFVLEGEVIPRQRFAEGPFGEFPGSLSGTKLQYRVKINRITHRRNPIFENLYMGRPWTEIDVFEGLSTCVPIYRQVKDSMPEIKAVNALHLHGNAIIFSVSQRNPGFSKIALMKVASTQHGVGFAHVVIAVDADVDPFNLSEVMWGLATRVRPVQDVWVVPGTPGGFLTPTTETPTVDDRLFIDATTKLPPAMKRQVQMVEKPAGVEEAMKVLAALQSQAQK